MFKQINKMLFIDIETVPAYRKYEELSDEMKLLWNEKFTTLKTKNPYKYGENTSDADGFENNAGIFSEFGKIICISVGIIYTVNNTQKMRITSFAGDDELSLLENFNELITSLTKKRDVVFCGHNIKEFDIPYICRRMTIQNIELPEALQINTKKPWEVNIIDTMDYWKFGDYKNYTSLKLLTAVLGIPTPKDDIDGSEVASVYYKENNLQRIVEYCQKDVVATAQVWLRLNSLPMIDMKSIEFVEQQ